MLEMKKIVLTSLTCFISTVAFADQDVVVPTLEGGVTASIGTFYATPSTGDYNYANHATSDSASFPFVTTPAYNTTDYDFGFEASLGYLFEETANGVELSYRGLHSSTNASVTADGSNDDFIGVPGDDTHTYAGASNELTYDFDTVDLMFSQFVNFGEFVQMRFSGGLAYAYIKQKSQTFFNGDGVNETDDHEQMTESKFSGLGPRLGTDGRYDFGDGFGILGGVSLAYLIGDLDSNNQMTNLVNGEEEWNYQENIDNHAILNVRANLGIDYVFFIDNDEGSTVGVELGYLADYYVEAVNEITGGMEAHNYGPSSVLQSASFCRPLSEC